MKEKIINILVIVVMAVIANYGLYKSLQKTADELSDIVQTIQDEVVAWQSDVNRVQNNIEEIRLELSGIIDRIESLKHEPKKINDAIDSIKAIKPVDTIKDLLKIRG
tara:strand:+ start:376 stop:696 length:321 start_codon:yes stop_codon:yes gene_type:complete